MIKSGSAGYLAHRQRVLAAVSNTDESPPLLRVGKVLNAKKLKEDADTYIRMTKGNAQLLMTLNGKMRMGGILNTFPKPFHHRRSNLKKKYLMLRTLEERNFIFGQRIMQAKSVLDSRAPDIEEQLVKRVKVEKHFALPTKILEKYGSQLNLTSSNISLRKLFRPLIFFNLEIKGIKPMGRIIVELYTEAAPQVVYELTKICSESANDQLFFIRLFPTLWLEGEINLSSDSHATKRIEYDMRALDHGSSAGILSFARSNLMGFRYGKLSFTVSFKPLRILNGKRLAFGKVVRGLKILDTIQCYGSKNGKLKREIRTFECGLIR